MLFHYYGLNNHTVKVLQLSEGFFQINCLLANTYDEKVILNLIYIKISDACRHFIKFSVLVQPL